MSSLRLPVGKQARTLPRRYWSLIDPLVEHLLEAAALLRHNEPDLNGRALMRRSNNIYRVDVGRLLDQSPSHADADQNDKGGQQES